MQAADSQPSVSFRAPDAYIPPYMAIVPNPRAIVHRKELQARLDELFGWEGAHNAQPKALALYKEALDAGYAEIRRRFEDEVADGRAVIRANAYLADQIVRTVHETAVRHIYPAANPTEGERMSVVATGGYGRGELAPFSDIDLLFLLPYKITPHGEQVVEYVLYTLWDLGLKVGHATRSIDEAIRLAKEDVTIRTSMLEARWITGERQLVDEFKQRFAKEIVKGRGKTFVEAKLAERDRRHERMGDTRYVLEPNIKEGKGGLRDLQTLSWIAKFLYQAEDVAELREKGVFTRDDAKRFTKAHTFLWTVRCHLHYLAGRPEERLTFNMQADIGRRMGYTDHAGTQGVERFMKHYYLVAKDVGDLTRVLCAVLEERQTKRSKFRLPTFGLGSKDEVEGFAIDRGRLKVEDDDTFAEDPVKLLSMFRVAQQHDLDVHPDTLRRVRQNLKRVDAKLRKDARANAEFMAMLTGRNPETALTRLNEAGVFGRFVPDFGRVVAQMQYDMYHVYTVDEHTIRAIGILNGIETGRLDDDHPVACSVFGEVQSRRVLYVAVLLHDIAKGRGGDHSELGAKIALKLCPRLGLSEWETETVSWLVLHHLAMSNTAFKRDPDDPKTVQDFVSLVQSPERLRLLLVLTVADIRAVGPNVWNAWKAGLLRELYWRTYETLTGNAPEARRQQRVENAKARLAEQLAGWPEAECQAHLERGTDDYWLAFDVDVHARHAEMVRRAETEGRELTVETLADPDRDVTEVVVYALDHPGLFAHIAGAIALAGFSIVDAKIATLKNGMALDTFSIQTAGGEALEEQSRLDRLEQRIAQALAGKLHPGTELRRQRKEALPSRTSVFKVPPRVLIDNKASTHFTVIEINGRDRAGLLHDLTRKLTTLGLQIGSAMVSTYGERVVDVFYVKDVFGLKVTHEDKIRAIQAELLDTIDPEGEHRAADAGDGRTRPKPPSKRSIRIGRRKAEPPKDPVEQKGEKAAVRGDKAKHGGKGSKPQAAE